MSELIFPGDGVPEDKQEVTAAHISEEPALVTESQLHERLRKGCGTFLLLAAICGGGYSALFTKAGGWGLNVVLFSTIWCLCSSIALKRLEIWKGGKNIFYLAGIMLLALSVFMTMNGWVQTVGCGGIILLMCMMLLENFCQTEKWQFGKYFTAVFTLVFSALPKLPEPIIHVMSMRKGKVSGSSKIKYVVLGIIISIPLAAFVIYLLMSADEMFSRLLEGLFTWNIEVPVFFTTAAKALIGFIIIFFSFYCVIAAQCAKPVSSELKPGKSREPIVAVTFIAVLTTIYAVFCVIQIIYLFIGRGSVLPAGYTYAQYARSGFFELLYVSLFNVALVIFCSWKFAKSRLLSIMLIVFSCCTYIMIASSACRMLLYVNAYGLTFLRIIVLWFLAVLTIIMTGTIISIFNSRFRLFRFCITICLVMWLFFAFVKPDRIAAKYNVENFGMCDDTVQNMLYDLSMDAVPIMAENNYNGSTFSEEYKGYLKYSVERAYNRQGVRGFNLSLWEAERAVEKSDQQLFACSIK